MKTPAADKSILNPEEAIQLYDLSRRRFKRLISGKKHLPFVALYNTRKLIIRSEFEKYLEANPEQKEALRNGRRQSDDEETGQQETGLA